MAIEDRNFAAQGKGHKALLGKNRTATVGHQVGRRLFLFARFPDPLQRLHRLFELILQSRLGLRPRFPGRWRGYLLDLGCQFVELVQDIEAFHLIDGVQAFGQLRKSAGDAGADGLDTDVFLGRHRGDPHVAAEVFH